MRRKKKLGLVQVGGASFVRCLPLFSNDGKLLFCPCGSDVKVFSTTTGECIRKLVCGNEVTGIVQHPNNKLQVISSTKSGVLKVWDYEDAIPLKSVKVASSISSLFCDPSIKSWAFVIENTETGVLKQVPLNPMSENEDDFQEIGYDISSEISQPVGSLKSGRYIVFLKNKEICVMNVGKVAEHVEHKAVRDGQVTCFACHPQEDCIATGHKSGKVKIWHNVCPTSGKPKPSVVSTSHWHSNPLTGLSFTPGGSSLLSVGLESVLVQWHYKDGSKQSFLPRLGSPCNHVVTTPDGTMYATTHNDNSVSIISNNFSIKHTIQGLTHVEGGNSSHKIFQYDPRTRSCVTIGKPGHLIFYDPVDDREVYSLDITHENFVSGIHKSKHRYAEITCVANQEDSKNEKAWMATMETSGMGEFLVENKLKFWILNEADKWWKLNTVINYPHDKDVTRLCFRPVSSHLTQSYMVSTGTGGMVKLWGFQQNTSYWSCVATASYREWPALYCDFSQDGSVLAVAFSHVVCLLDPLTLETSLVIQSNEKNEQVEKLMFGRHSCQQMIIVQSKSCIQAYDLLSGVLSWVADMRISHITADPSSEFMYMLSKSGDLYVIRPSSSELVFNLRNVNLKNVLSMMCIPHSNSCHISKDDCSSVPWMAHSRLYIADVKLSVFTLLGRDHDEVHMASRARKSEHNHFMTPMAHILDKDSNVSNSNDVAESLNVPQVRGRDIARTVKTITDSPAHILPSIANHCGSFLTSFLEALQINDPKIPILDGPQFQAGVGALDSTTPKIDSSSRIIESTNSVQPRAVQMKFLGEL